MNNSYSSISVIGAGAWGTAIASTLSKNQIVAFILGVFITFFLFNGFDAVADSFENNSLTIQKLGIKEHYKSISRGVIDTRDILYFVSVTLFFLFITKTKLDDE